MCEHVVRILCVCARERVVTKSPSDNSHWYCDKFVAAWWRTRYSSNITILCLRSYCCLQKQNKMSPSKPLYPHVRFSINGWNIALARCGSKSEVGLAVRLARWQQCQCWKSTWGHSGATCLAVRGVQDPLSTGDLQQLLPGWLYCAFTVYLRWMSPVGDTASELDRQVDERSDAPWCCRCVTVGESAVNCEMWWRRPAVVWNKCAEKIKDQCQPAGHTSAAAAAWLSVRHRLIRLPRLRGYVVF